jgi:hypothetical protein
MPSEEEEIINLIAQELAAGRPPEMVAEELVQAGLPRDEAIQVVQAVAGEMARRGGGGGAPMPRGGGGFNWGYFFMIIAILVLLYILIFM